MIFSLKGVKNAGYTLLSCVTLCVAMILSSTAFATTVIIKPNTAISASKKYSGVTLDMTSGSFNVTNGAILTLENCQVTGTLSNDNPVLFNIENGQLQMQNNTVSVRTFGLDPHPLTQSLQYVVQVNMGSVNLNGNRFSIDQPFTAGMLVTTSPTPTTGLAIVSNKFDGFHGVLYLINSSDAVVTDNVLTKNSFGNIVLLGDNGQILRNTIAFSGNNHLGNSMDIFNSDGVVISNNILLTPTCHGIYILNSHHLQISDNRIMGGITYAMNILTYPETMKGRSSGQKMDSYVKDLMQTMPTKTVAQTVSSDIVIQNNYMGQNRFGIAANDVDGLTVSSNYFVQRFADAASRQFWTDNSVLLQDVTNLSWTSNLYREAFSQDMNGDNSKSLQFVSFPETGGVQLP